MKRCSGPDARLTAFATDGPAARIRVSVPVEISEETRADVALLERVTARDHRALAELYDRHARVLFGLILRIVRSYPDAEDVLQEVFVQAWTRTDTYNASLGSPAGWLIGIARHRAIDRLRNSAVRTRAAESAPPPRPPETPETRAATSERQRDVARALASLPPEQRELIEHAYFEGLTQSELAERFKLPLGTVKTRVRTGLSTLRGLLQRTLLEL
jgi:RNA polymerase sigma-70 factor, ECF subfamily